METLRDRAFVPHQRLKKNSVIDLSSPGGKFHFFRIYKVMLQGDYRFAIALLHLALLNYTSI
ncbi:MAG: hypothetical protein AB1861_27585 [Cyanobacteriota bacterium]